MSRSKLELALRASRKHSLYSDSLWKLWFDADGEGTPAIRVIDHRRGHRPITPDGGSLEPQQGIKAHTKT